MNAEIEGALRIAAAAVGGLAVGVERQWSGHATGPGARFGGVRTFSLLGGLAGIAGWLWSGGLGVPATVLLLGASALVVAGYVAASRRDVEATTEVAGLIVLAAGVLAGAGHLELASGVVAVTLLALVEKSRLHAMVGRLSDAEVRAGSRFAIMAVVILPLLPPGPYGPLGGVRPRELWAIVLLFAGLSFAGYIARRAVGARRGYAVAGLLGGFVSSTSVTLNFARASRLEPALGGALAGGVVAASTVLFVRTLLAAAILSPPLARAALPLLVPPFLAGVAASAWSLRLPVSPATEVAPSSNPLQMRSALQMALLFQAVLFAVHVVREQAGDAGLLLSGAVLGLMDVDALTISMAKSVAAKASAGVAAGALAIGIASNTLVKLAFAVTIGRGRFRVLAAVGLLAIAVASAAALLLCAPR